MAEACGMRQRVRFSAWPCLMWIISLVNSNSQNFFVKTKTETKTFTSRPRPRPRVWVSRPRARLYSLSSRRLETKTVVSRTTSLEFSTICRDPHPTGMIGLNFGMRGDIDNVITRASFCDNRLPLILPFYVGLAGRPYNSESNTVLHCDSTVSMPWRSAL